MLKTSSIPIVSAALLVFAAPAQAQISVGVGADVDLGVNLRVGDPYVYHGYHSDRWYYEEYRREGRYYETYGGYDCHKGFKYTWHDDYRARYEAYWCFDDNDRRYEARKTRAVVRIR